MSSGARGTIAVDRTQAQPDEAAVGAALAVLGDFLTRAGADWHHSEWDSREVIAAGPTKVHLDVQFTRYRIDNSVIGSFRSLWIVTARDGCWAVAARSGFAA